MKRQSVRKLILILMLLLFPVTIWYFSPYLIIAGALEGIVNGSFMVFVFLFLTSILTGRLFCGYLCPMSGLSECVSMVRPDPPAQKFLKYIKYGIWICWLLVIAVCFVFQKKEVSLHFFYMTDHGISVSNIYAYIIYYGVIFLVLIPGVILGKRWFCHAICWIAPFMTMGTGLRRLLHLPGLHLKGTRNSCVSCGKCDKVCPMGLEVQKMVQEEKKADSECILCGECIDSCPKKALAYHFGKEGI